MIEIKKICITMLFVIVLITGCTNVSRSTINLTTSTEKSYSEEYNLKSREDMKTFRISFNISLEQGNFIWELYDPDNNLVDSQEITKDYKQTLNLDPIEGDWKFIIEAENIIGNVEINYLGK